MEERRKDSGTINKGNTTPKKAKLASREAITEPQEFGQSSSSMASPKKELSQDMDKDTFVSPKKPRLDWDFWKKQPDSETSIAELTVGSYKETPRKFRVGFKSSLRQTNFGPVFSFHAMDDSGVINVTAFGSECAKFFDVVQVNGIYEIEDFVVKTIKKENITYTGLSREVEINLRSTTKISRSQEKMNPIPFKFVKISDISSHTVSSQLDILAIMVKDWGVEEVTAKISGKVLKKRDISVTDASKATIVVTMWGDEAIGFKADEYSCIAVRGARVTEYQGTRSLNCGFGVLVWIGPEADGADELKVWFQENKPV